MRSWNGDVHSTSARSLAFVARSALKLLALSKSYPRLLPSGASVLDLGCSPGAFLQVASEVVGPKGFVFGVDLTAVDVGALERKQKKMTLTAPVFACVADVFDLTPRTLSELVREAVEREKRQEESRRSKLLLPPPFSVVLSDLCHSTLGVRSADAARSLELARAAAELALGSFDEEEETGGERSGVLASGGNLLLKFLEGEETRSFADEFVRPRFEALKWARPPATRTQSTEVYLLGLGRKK